MFSVGLTGGIGSGKSTVARCLVDGGAHLVDCDAIARKLTLSGGAALPALVAAFGPQALGADGALDRSYMRDLAFGDASAKARLQAILHPLIHAEAEHQACCARGKDVLFDVPLLAESTYWRRRVDRVLVVDCTELTQIERTAARPGWTRQIAQRVVAQQSSRAARRAIADAVIHNEDLTLTQLCMQARLVWACWVPVAT
jgi:dephospho-CoA kinase